MNVSAKIQKVVVCVVSSYMFLSLFAMNQRYCCFRCMKTLAIILIKIVISVVQSIGIGIFSSNVKKSVVSVVPAPSRDFVVLKHVLKTVH